MPDGRKIATCCYCGTRAVLVFDRARHELACSACGAPLHNMKSMPQSSENTRKKREKPVTSRRRVPEFPREYPRERYPGRAQSPQKRPGKVFGKRRKPLMRRVLEELWDEVEDIFD